MFLIVKTRIKWVPAFFLKALQNFANFHRGRFSRVNTILCDSNINHRLREWHLLVLGNWFMNRILGRDGDCVLNYQAWLGWMRGTMLNSYLLSFVLKVVWLNKTITRRGCGSYGFNLISTWASFLASISRTRHAQLNCASTTWSGLSCLWWRSWWYLLKFLP